MAIGFSEWACREPPANRADAGLRLRNPVLLHTQQLDLEDQSLVRPDTGRGCSFALGELGRDEDPPLRPLSLETRLSPFFGDGWRALPHHLAADWRRTGDRSDHARANERHKLVLNGPVFYE